MILPCLSTRSVEPGAIQMGKGLLGKGKVAHGTASQKIKGQRRCERSGFFGSNSALVPYL
jgi:hypothetical protein